MSETDFFEVLKDAIENPEIYSRGTSRKKLQASFDFLLAHICRDLCSIEFVNRQILRRKLNKMALDGLSDKELVVVGRLKEVLRECDPLFDKTYTDHHPDLQLFLKNHLSHLLKVM